MLEVSCIVDKKADMGNFGVILLTLMEECGFAGAWIYTLYSVVINDKFGCPHNIS